MPNARSPIPAVIRSMQQLALDDGGRAKIVGVVGQYLTDEEYNGSCMKLLRIFAGMSFESDKKFADMVREAGKTVRDQVSECVNSAIRAIGNPQMADACEVRFIDSLTPDTSKEVLSNVIDFLLQHSPHLRAIDFSYFNNITPELLQRLKGFSLLHTLSLAKCPIGDDHVAALKELTQLRKCTLRETLITGCTLALLSREIMELNLSGCSLLTDAGVEGLQGMRLDICMLPDHINQALKNRFARGQPQ